MPRETSPDTLPAALAETARRHPARAIAIGDRRGRRWQRRTYAELLESARSAAARLAGAGLAPGDALVVSLPTSWAWLDTWIGAILLGARPVATAPGGLLGSGDEHLRALRAALDLVEARALVCLPRVRDALGRSGPPPAARLFTAEELAGATPLGSPPVPEPDPNGVAFLQLTSGTLGRQRAVRIRHRGLAHNVAAISEAITRPLGRPVEAFDARVVSWLPLYHDMGLVGSLLAGLLHGLEVFLLPPEAFLGRPRLWLERLGGWPAVASTAPNFGYQFCTETVADAEIEGLDLSGWQAALVGAEMIHPETLRAFAERFAAHGFELESFRPCYGMAEATLAVTIDGRGEGPRTRRVPGSGEAGSEPREVVCVGSPIDDTRLSVTAPDGSELPDDRVGEVRIAGPGVFAGYLGDPQATAESLEDGWLRTGDLGFLHDGELYLTGRLKDILIVRGQNVMPHELERLAEEASGGGGARRAGAFAVTRGPAGEEIVIVAEAPPGRDTPLSELADRIRRRVGEALALPVADVVFVRAGALPRTTSGKVRRLDLRRAYEQGTLTRLSDSE